MRESNYTTLRCGSFCMIRSMFPEFPIFRDGWCSSSSDVPQHVAGVVPPAAQQMYESYLVLSCINPYYIPVDGGSGLLSKGGPVTKLEQTHIEGSLCSWCSVLFRIAVFLQLYSSILRFSRARWTIRPWCGSPTPATLVINPLSHSRESIYPPTRE